ncbi:MAG: hypothetical protein ACLQVN_12595 [Bryobacteraceae bacterium]
MVRISLLLLLLLWPGGRLLSAQDDSARAVERAPRLKSEIENDRALRVGFEAALAHNLDAARRYLPLVIGKPWLGEADFRAACALAQAVGKKPGDQTRDPALAEKLVLAAGLRNPALALRETGQYLPLAGGNALFERFVLAAPDQAMGLASGTGASALEVRRLMSASKSPELALLTRLAEDSSIDLPRHGRVAILSGRIARGELSFQSALRIAASTPRFFATVLDMRIGGAGADAAPLDRALANESLVLCQAAQQDLDGVLANDLAHFRAADLYALLALGRAEATPPVFRAVFDRLLLPKWKSEKPKGSSFTALLDRTDNWELRDFAAGALAAGRFDSLLSLEGFEVVGRLARGVDRSGDPVAEAMRLAEIVDATTSAALRDEMAAIVSREFVRCSEAGDLRGATLYGLLAAKLSMNAAAAPYRLFLRSSATLDTALLFGAENDCIERYFFYDDDDGVESFASFRKSYAHDPAWEMEDRGEYVHLASRGPEGRRIEIFANVPVDAHLAKNRALEGEAERRQRAITAALDKRGLVATVMVHRGHSFWVERTLTYLARSTRLVILGSCGGVTEIHQVIEASHDAQVIATRGVGETEINDAILKAVNDRILQGERIVQWDSFWRELEGRWGKSAPFREYVSPDQDSGTVFLRAYHRYMDALE